MPGQIHATDGKGERILRVAGAEYPRTQVVMVTDDDVYVRADRIVAGISTFGQYKGLYVGERSDTLHPAPLAPIRDPSEAYYTSRQSYPLKSFPPYAGGPYYLVSMDCIRFIAKNRSRLASVGGMEDTSIALWLLAIQVHVQYSPALASLRVQPCQSDFLSYANLSPLGIRVVDVTSAMTSTGSYVDLHCTPLCSQVYECSQV